MDPSIQASRGSSVLNDNSLQDLTSAISSQHFNPCDVDPNVGSSANQEAFGVDLMARVGFRMKGTAEVFDIEKPKRLIAERLRPSGRNFQTGGLHGISSPCRFAAVRQHPCVL